MGPGRSVQGVQEAAAAEGGPARSQGCLTPGVRLPLPFHHVHWGRGRAGERETRSEGTAHSSVPCRWHVAPVTETPEGGLRERGSHACLVHSPSLLRCLAHVRTQETFLRCTSAGHICSAAVRKRFPATSPSPSNNETQPAPELTLVPSDAVCSEPRPAARRSGHRGQFCTFSHLILATAQGRPHHF